MLPHEEELEELLRRCVVKVVAPRQGTGFFVAPGLLVTARHVVTGVAEGGTVKIRVPAEDPDLPQPLTATVEPGSWGDYPDIALLRVDPSIEHPCVVLDTARVQRDEPLLAAGFIPPSTSIVGYQARSFSSQGQQNFAGRDPYLRLDDDTLVNGMSGGPVLSRESGLVVAVLRLTSDSRLPVGGFAVPMSAIVPLVTVLRDLTDRPPETARPWLQILGASHLKSLGRDPDGSRPQSKPPFTETIRLGMHPSSAKSPLSAWKVSAQSTTANDPVQWDVSAADLGDDVMEAVERWSRRCWLETSIEVKILGTLLQHALLPDTVASVVEGCITSGGRPLVQLEVDGSGRVAPFPWEYIRSGVDALPLAARTDLAFSRVVNVPGQAVTEAPQVRVLAAVVCPKRVHGRLPKRLNGLGPQLKPPDAEAMRVSLSGALKDRFKSGDPRQPPADGFLQEAR